MAVFDHLRSLIQSTPQNKTALVFCMPYPNDSRASILVNANSVELHDDQGLIEFRNGSNAQFVKASDWKSIAVVHAAGNIGEQLKNEQPDAWKEMNEESRQVLLALVL